MRVAVLEVGARREQRAGLAQVGADRPVGRVELVVDDAALAAEPQPVGAVHAAAHRPRTPGRCRCALHSSKSSSPWSGAMWTRPVPWSVVTKSPGRNGRGLAKKPPSLCIGWRAMVPASVGAFADAQSLASSKPIALPSCAERRCSTKRLGQIRRHAIRRSDRRRFVADQVDERRTQRPARKRSPG